MDKISKRRLTPNPNNKEMKEEKYLRKWHAGNIALFGAILMSHGITGKDKEFLKKLMYQALTAEKPKPMKHDTYYEKNYKKHPEWFS